MGDKSAIEWTDATWNPIVGCSIVSPGCTNCYAMTMAARINKMTPATHYAGLTRQVNGHQVWTGKLALAPDHIITAPLRWRKPRRIFVNSMGDLFHEDVPDEWIDKIFAIMALRPDHTFQILTKRSKRMREYMEFPHRHGKIAFLAHERFISHAHKTGRTAEIGFFDLEVPCRKTFGQLGLMDWPMPRVWLGVSCEDQARADERIPDLLATPAAVRFVSAEPLLGPIDFKSSLRPTCDRCPPWDTPCVVKCENLSRLHWIIAGGESGPGARPMHPDWVRSIRDQCAAAGTAFFFKQWGEWGPPVTAGQIIRTLETADLFDDRWAFDRQTWGQSAMEHVDDEPDLYRVGKKVAGRLLDGFEHNGYPA